MAELIYLHATVRRRLPPVFRGVEGMQSESDLDRIK